MIDDSKSKDPGSGFVQQLFRSPSLGHVIQQLKCNLQL